MAAALVPRVRVIAVCDEAIASEMEADVFTLENVRYDAVAEVFPHERTLWVYLLLSHYREGQFSGAVQVLRHHTHQVVRHERFKVTFDGQFESTAIYVEIARCVFPAPGVTV